MVVLAQRAAAIARYLADSALPFDILVDESRQVAKTYGVWHRIGLDAWNIARPALFLIDPDGSVRYQFIGASQADFPSQDEILRIIAT